MSNINFKQNPDGTYDLIAKINNRNRRILRINKNKISFDSIVEINQTIKVKDSKKGSGLIVPIRTSTSTKTGSMFYDSDKDSLNVFTETTGVYKEIKTTEIDTSMDVAGGGTGLSSLESNNILVGSGTSIMTPKTLVGGFGTSITNNTNDITISSTVLDTSGNLTIDGDIKVSGGDIKDGGGNSAIQLTGSGNVDIVGNLTTRTDLNVQGGDIQFETLATDHTLYGGNQTSADTAGKNMIIKASAGKGSGVGGSIKFQTANAGTGGGSNVVNTHVDSLVIDDDGDVAITGDLTVTGSIETNDGELLVKAGDGDHASILLHADNSDDDGDDWSIQSNIDNRLYIYNNKSGSAVSHLSITPNATVANSTIAAQGKFTAAGDISSTSGEVRSGWHGNSSVVKFYPNQFVESDDTSGRYYAVVEDDLVPFGIRVTHTSAIMYAFIPIPTGYKATHVRCYGATDTNITVDTFEHDIDDGLRSASLGSGDASAEINITDVASTATNSILIKLTFANNSTSFYGGYMTIVAT